MNEQVLKDQFEKAITAEYLAAGANEPDLKTAVQDGCLFYFNPLVQSAWWGFKSSAAPQPPSVVGEVEVVRQYLSKGSFARWMPMELYEVEQAQAEGFETRELVDRQHFTALSQQLAAVTAERDRLLTMLDTPHTAEWFEGVRLEAGHQIKRWGTSHDAGKQPADWFWLIGFLAQKAMTAQMAGNDQKARHHTISTGAAMLNWFRAIVGESTAMRPGIDDSVLTQQVTKDA